MAINFDLIKVTASNVCCARFTQDNGKLLYIIVFNIQI